MADIRTVTTIRTEAQVRTHEGFAPTYRTHKQGLSLRSANEKHEWLFAEPPEWTELSSCLGMYPVFDDPDAEDRAYCKRVCADCPVFEECKADALEAEIGVNGKRRGTYRAGLTQWDRVRIHLASPVCPGCGEDGERVAATGACVECSSEARAARRDLVPRAPAGPGQSDEEEDAA